MSVDPGIGQIITGDQVENAVRDTLQLWMPTYLAELERQTGRAAHDIPAIRAYTTTVDFDSWVEDQLPRVMLIATGMSQEPQRQGSSAYDARWAVAVGVVASARTQVETNALAKFYGAAIRAAIVQHRSLGGFALGTEWRDERYDDLSVDQIRSLGGVRMVFEVEVANVVQSNGPSVPAVDPYAVPPPPVEILTADATTILEAI